VCVCVCVCVCVTMHALCSDYSTGSNFAYSSHIFLIVVDFLHSNKIQ
jgi:hypothetical protein